jgi:histone-arginine methyltransferase CARM1
LGEQGTLLDEGQGKTTLGWRGQNSLKSLSLLFFSTLQNFYGIDVTPFADAAWEEVFSSPVVGCFGPLILLSPSTNYNVDFLTITKENLKKFAIPLSFDVSQTSVVHGLAGWFDLHFLPTPAPSTEAFSHEDTLAMEEAMNATSDVKMSTAPDAGNSEASNGESAKEAAAAAAILGVNVGFDALASENITSVSHVDPTISSSYMTTSPYATPTHWQQVRFLFQEPLAINRGQRIVGEMLCEVNDFR